MDSLLTILFSPFGRLSRSDYWLKAIPIQIVVALAQLYLVFTMLAAMEHAQGVNQLGWAIFFILSTVMMWVGVVTSIKRLHDMDRSGWWLLASMIPVIGWFIWIFFMFKGTEGPNRFGHSPM